MSPGKEETQKRSENPLSYLPEVTHVRVAVGLLAEIQKLFSERWVLLLHAGVELFDSFLLGPILGPGPFLLRGLGSETTGRRSDEAGASRDLAPLSMQPRTATEAHHPLFTNETRSARCCALGATPVPRAGRGQSQIWEGQPRQVGPRVARTWRQVGWELQEEKLPSLR